jgi:hypothetical protein
MRDREAEIDIHVDLDDTISGVDVLDKSGGYLYQAYRDDDRRNPVGLDAEDLPEAVYVVREDFPHCRIFVDGGEPPEARPPRWL